MSAKKLCKGIEPASLLIYNASGVLCSAYLIHKLTPEAIGLKEPLVSSYARTESLERVVFNISELLFFHEMLFHVLGWQELRRHIFIFGLWSLFIAMAVLPFYPTHWLVIYWVLLRSVRKMLRLSHRIYLEARKRKSSAVMHPLERLCVDVLAFSYPLEYGMSCLLVLVAYPVIRYSDKLQF
mmetsp:Transcript_23409/g.29092  ORF Transcript_23409/g.29092 Transcript_23409/m.29092 type:complete len:182 (+) Transcript_23409:1-546(+)